jgi:hypothetical protein
MPAGACVAPCGTRPDRAALDTGLRRFWDLRIVAIDAEGAMPASLAYNMAPLRFDLLPP